MQRRVFTDGDIQSVVEAYRKLRNGPEVARQLGMATTSVYRLLAKAGEPRIGNVPPPHDPRSRKFSEAIEREIATRYAAGDRTGMLTNEYGASKWLIRDIARRHGVRLFGRGNRDRVFPDREIRRMVDLWVEGAPQAEIARHLRTHQVVVSRVLRAQGIAPHARHAAGADHGSWRGGRTANMGGQGYVGILVRADHPFASMRNRQGYIPEHRLVMATKLGRSLSARENVHHINGNRGDNRLENLELWTRPQPNGVRAAGVPHCATCTCARE